MGLISDAISTTERVANGNYSAIRAPDDSSDDSESSSSNDGGSSTSGSDTFDTNTNDPATSKQRYAQIDSADDTVSDADGVADTRSEIGDGSDTSKQQYSQIDSADDSATDANGVADSSSTVKKIANERNQTQQSDTGSKQEPKKTNKGLGNQLAEITGAKKYTQSDQFEKYQQNLANVEGKGVVAGAKRFNIRTKAGMDFFLDNPQASVQDTVRGGIEGGAEAATGEELQKGDMAKAAQKKATEFRKETSSWTEGTAAEPITDGAVWLGDAVVADPVKTVTKGATGIDVDKGTAEGSVGAGETAFTALDIATLGSGSTLKAGAKGVASRITRSGADDVAQAGTREAGEQATREAGEQATRETGEQAARNSETTTDPLVNFARESEQRAASEATEQTANQGNPAFDALGFSRQNADDFGPLGFPRRAGDDAAETGTREAGEETAEQGTREVSQSGSSGVIDDAGQTTIRATGDDATEGTMSRSETLAAIGEDLFGAGKRSSDEAASTGDDTAQAATREAGEETAERTVRDKLLRTGSSTSDDAAEGGIRNWIKGNKGGIALGGGAATLAATQIKTASGQTLKQVKQYEPNDRFQNGGRLWSVTGADGTDLGFWTTVGQRGRNLIVLNDDGSTRNAKIAIDQFREMKSGGNAGGGN